MFFILIVCSCVYGFVQEQYLMDIYDQMNSLKEYISQLEYYTALEELEWKSKSDREFEEEVLTIYFEHYADLQKMLKSQLTQSKNEKDDILMFLHETYLKAINLLKRLIIDKDKLIEGDVKELAKIKHQAREDNQKRFDEYSFLLQKIKEVQDTNKIEDIFKTLELLESKIMIGIFKPYQNSEVDFFIKMVDKLFKENEPANQKIEALQLLSIMRSVIQEILITMMNEQLESSLDLLEKELFYTQSKVTHIQAKESLVLILQQFEGMYAQSQEVEQNQWSQQTQQEEDDTLFLLFQSNLEHASKIGNQSIQYHQHLQDVLKTMLERFLQR